MRHQGADALSNLLVVLIVAGGAVWVLERWGYDLGWRNWLPCGGVGPAAVGANSELLILAGLAGTGLAFIPSTRSVGIGIVILALAGLYALELLPSALQTVCSGVQPVP